MDVNILNDVLKIMAGIITVLNFLGVIFIIYANKVAFNKIITNDLHHLSADIKGLKDEQTCIKEKVIDLSESVAYIKGQAAIMFSPKKRVSSVSKRKVVK